MRFTVRQYTRTGGAGAPPPLRIAYSVENAVANRERASETRLAPTLNDGAIHHKLMAFFKQYGCSPAALPGYLLQCDALLREYGCEPNVDGEDAPNPLGDDNDEDEPDVISTRPDKHADDAPNQTLDGFELSFVLPSSYKEVAAAPKEPPAEPEANPKPPGASSEELVDAAAQPEEDEPQPVSELQAKRQAFMDRLSKLLNQANLTTVQPPEYDEPFNRVSVLLSHSNLDMDKLADVFGSLNVSSPRIFAANGRKIGIQCDL